MEHIGAMIPQPRDYPHFALFRRPDAGVLMEAGLPFINDYNDKNKRNTYIRRFEHF